MSCVVAVWNVFCEEQAVDIRIVVQVLAGAIL